jgi:hypothetical protein
MLYLRKLEKLKCTYMYYLRDYASSIGNPLFWTFIHYGSWPKWLKKIHIQYVINDNNILYDRIDPSSKVKIEQVELKKSDVNKFLIVIIWILPVDEASFR